MAASTPSQPRRRSAPEETRSAASRASATTSSRAANRVPARAAGPAAGGPPSRRVAAATTGEARRAGRAGRLEAPVAALPPGTQGRRPAARKPLPSQAAADTVRANVTEVSLPLLGTVTLPPMEHVAWYLGVGLLTAVELVEWPVALVLVAGKLLADNRSHQTLRVFGELLDDAV